MNQKSRKTLIIVAKRLSALILFLFSIHAHAHAQLRMSNYFADHMILQRDETVNLNGWSVPGKQVSVQMDQKNYQTVTKPDSSWNIQIPAFGAGGPHMLTVMAAGEILKFEDIYFGDIWFCSGQSNMSFQVKQADNYLSEVKDADYPLIRELGLALESSIYLKTDIKKTTWKKANAGTIGNFSAVAWFFAKELYQKNKIPIGIIHSSWGGTPIEAFMDAKTVQAFPQAKRKLDQLTPEFMSTTMANNERLVKETGIPEPKGFVNVRNGFPTIVYNAMVAPLFKFPVKGVLWYQGEANSHLPVCLEYERLLTEMITSWRSSWKKPDLPFIIVQLANYTQKVTAVSPISGWAVLQEAQYRVSQSLKNVGIVVTNDLGNPKDPHPTNKQDVGKRAAAIALHESYGFKNLIANGPSMRSVEIAAGKVSVLFNGIGGGLVAKNSDRLLNGFLLAGEDLQFYPAKAEIEGNKVIVTCKEVPLPAYVRYAFTDNPPSVNFYNKEGFPAVPFRTDQETGKSRQ